MKDQRLVTALLFLFPTALLACLALYSVASLSSVASGESFCGEKHEQAVSALNAVLDRLRPATDSATAHRIGTCSISKIAISAFVGIGVDDEKPQDVPDVRGTKVCDALRDSSLPFSDCKVAKRTLYGPPVLPHGFLSNATDDSFPRIIQESELKRSVYLKGLQTSPLEDGSEDHDGIHSDRFEADKHVQVLVYYPSQSEGEVVVENTRHMSEEDCSTAPVSVEVDAQGDSASRPSAASSTIACDGKAKPVVSRVAVLSRSSAVVFMPPLIESGAKQTEAAVEVEVEALIVQAVQRVLDLDASARFSPCLSPSITASHVAAHRLSRALRRYADLCDAVHVSVVGSSGEEDKSDGERGAKIAGGNLFVHPAIATKILADYRRIEEVARSLQEDNSTNGDQAARSSSSILSRAAALTSHPSIAYDHYIPWMHRLAIYLPPWAPVVMPILLAVLIGIRRVRTAQGAMTKGERKQYTLRLKPERLFSPSSVSTPTASSSSSDTEGSIPIPLVVRGIQPGDTRALRNLYVLGQLQHAKDNYRLLPHLFPGEKYQGPKDKEDLFGGEDGGLFWRAHERWTDFVLTSDLKDPHRHYSSEQQQFPDKANFWVATMSVEDFNRFPGTGTGASAALEAVVRKAATIKARIAKGETKGVPKGFSVDSTQMRFVLNSDEGKEGRKGEQNMMGSDWYLDAEGRVVVGTIAVTPWVPEGHGSDDGSSKDKSKAKLEAQRKRKLETPVAELIRMCVHARIHRCGLASTLLKHLEDFCRQPKTGYKQIYLGTLSTMVAGVALYRANGYDYGKAGQGGLLGDTVADAPVFGAKDNEGSEDASSAETASPALPPNPARGRRENYEGDEIFVVELVKDIARSP